MATIYIPEIQITQDEYDMIQDNQVPIDTFIANKIREDAMFVYVQEPGTANFMRAQNYEWSDELYARQVPNKKFENPNKRSTICDI
tara:strand:- start:130 stop:387 length:258 start_codon:yes stop_codon:yes gene_type:complete